MSKNKFYCTQNMFPFATQNTVFPIFHVGNTTWIALSFFFLRLCDHYVTVIVTNKISILSFVELEQNPAIHKYVAVLH